jgi:hypothetical protein
MTKATKAATAVRKPVSTFIPVMAPLVPVGVVLVSELVLDSVAVVGVAAVAACLWAKVRNVTQGKTVLLTK